MTPEGDVRAPRCPDTWEQSQVLLPTRSRGTDARVPVGLPETPCHPGGFVLIGFETTGLSLMEKWSNQPVSSYGRPDIPCVPRYLQKPAHPTNPGGPLGCPGSQPSLFPELCPRPTLLTLLALSHGPAVPFQYVLPGARITCPIVEIRSGG